MNGGKIKKEIKKEFVDDNCDFLSDLEFLPNDNFSVDEEKALEIIQNLCSSGYESDFQWT